MADSPTSLLLRSKETQTEYHVFVDTALAKEAGRLLLILDGDDQFEPACEVVRAGRDCGELPPLLPVGVGYGGGYRSAVNRRARDYTPTRPAGEPMETGGAAAFLRFLERELIPFLTERYRFAHDDIALGGHSLGSLFVLYALAQRVSPFRRYLVSSPSIWWDDRAVLKDVAVAAAEPATPRRAFFSVGTEDTPSMTGDLELLEKQLRERPVPGVHHTFQRFPGKDHYNALPIAYATGLRWLYSEG